MVLGPMAKIATKLLDLSSFMDGFGPYGLSVNKTADLGSSMDGFGTVRKKQPKSQISKVLSLSLGSGIIVDFLSAFLLLPYYQACRKTHAAAK